MIRHLLAIIVITAVSIWCFWKSPNNLVAATETETLSHALSPKDLPLPKGPAREPAAVVTPTPGATPTPDYYNTWVPYRDEMYRNVSLTANEINRLNEITKIISKDQDFYKAQAKTLGKHFPKLGEAVATNMNGNLQKILERDATLLLGKDRYEYLIKAKKAFFDTYNKKTGQNVYESEW